MDVLVAGSGRKVIATILWMVLPVCLAICEGAPAAKKQHDCCPRKSQHKSDKPESIAKCARHPFDAPKKAQASVATVVPSGGTAAFVPDAPCIGIPAEAMLREASDLYLRNRVLRI